MVVPSAEVVTEGVPTKLVSAKVPLPEPPLTTDAAAPMGCANKTAAPATANNAPTLRPTDAIVLLPSRFGPHDNDAQGARRGLPVRTLDTFPCKRFVRSACGKVYPRPVGLPRFGIPNGVTRPHQDSILPSLARSVPVNRWASAKGGLSNTR